MRSILLTMDYFPNNGGVARYGATWAKYVPNTTVWADKVFTPRSPEEQWIPPAHQKTLFWKWANPHWFASVWLLWKERANYDHVVVSHVLPLGTAAYIASRFTHKSYTIQLHGLDFRLTQRSWWKRFLTRHILKNAHQVVVNSHALAQEVSHIIPPIKPIVVYPSLPKAWVISRPLVEQTGQELRLLTVSRVVERKGHKLILEAIAELKKTHPNISLKYHVVGTGPILSDLKSYTSHLGISSQVEFLGEATEAQKEQHYAWANVFAMPVQTLGGIDKEGFGMVYLEAAAYGLPVIATNIPGVDEAVLHEKTGVLLQEYSSDELAKTCAQLTNSTLRKQLGSAGKRRVEHEFTSEGVFTRLSFTNNVGSPPTRG